MFFEKRVFPFHILRWIHIERETSEHKKQPMDATSSSPSSSSSSCILDTFFLCEEQDHSWSHDDEHDHEVTQTTLQDSSHFHLPTLNNQDFLWEDEELVSLFTKEEQQGVLKTHPSSFSFDKTDPSLLLARKEAVEWILKVKSHFGFTHLTAILSIDYLDRFLASFHFQKDKPWMMQLLAVTCLSLAAKVEQTQVPPLLDLQVCFLYHMHKNFFFSFIM